MFKKSKKSKESVQGFTLVELIIIVAILGVLVAILAPAYTKYIEKSREVQIAIQNGHLCHVRRSVCDIIGGQPKTN